MSQTLLLDSQVGQKQVKTQNLATNKFSYRNYTYLLFMLVCALQCMLIALGVRVLLAGSYTTDLGGIETNVIYSIQTLLDNGRLYTNPGLMPFSITQYTPFYYYICAAIAKLILENPLADIHNLYVIGRSVNVIINAFTSVAVFLIAQRFIRVSSALAIIAALTAFIIQYGHDYAVRPDSLHDSLAIWAGYAMLLYLSKKQKGVFSTKALASAVCLGVLSIFAKQSGIQIPIILAGFLFAALDWRGLKVAVVTGVVFCGALMLLFISLYGEAFLQNVVGGVANGISVKEFVREILKAGSPRDIPFVIVKLIMSAGIAVYFSFQTWFMFRSTLIGRFLAFATMGSLAFATLTALKVGATMQYYYISQVFTMLLVIYSLWGPDSNFVANQKKRLQWMVSGFLLVLLLFQSSENVRTVKYHMATEWKPETKEVLRIKEFLQHEEGLQKGEYIFANVAAAKREGINNFMYRHATVPQLEIIEFSTGQLSVFGYRQFEQLLQNGTIKYLIESEPAYEFSLLPNLATIKERYYKPIMHFENYRLYRYKGVGTVPNNFSTVDRSIQ